MCEPYWCGISFLGVCVHSQVMSLCPCGSVNSVLALSEVRKSPTAVP